MVATTIDPQLDPVHYIFDMFYGILSGLTEIVGLSPVQFAGVLVGVIVLGLGYAFVQSARGKTGFHFNRDDGSDSGGDSVRVESDGRGTGA